MLVRCLLCVWVGGWVTSRMTVFWVYVCVVTLFPLFECEMYFLSEQNLRHIICMFRQYLILHHFLDTLLTPKITKDMVTSLAALLKSVPRDQPEAAVLRAPLMRAFSLLQPASYASVYVPLLCVCVCRCVRQRD